MPAAGTATVCATGAEPSSGIHGHDDVGVVRRRRWRVSTCASSGDRGRQARAEPRARSRARGRELRRVELDRRRRGAGPGSRCPTSDRDERGDDEHDDDREPGHRRARSSRRPPRRRAPGVRHQTTAATDPQQQLARCTRTRRGPPENDRSMLPVSVELRTRWSSRTRRSRGAALAVDGRPPSRVRRLGPQQRARTGRVRVRLGARRPAVAPGNAARCAADEWVIAVDRRARCRAARSRGPGSTPRSRTRSRRARARETARSSCDRQRLRQRRDRDDRERRRRARRGVDERDVAHAGRRDQVAEPHRRTVSCTSAIASASMRSASPIGRRPERTRVARTLRASVRSRRRRRPWRRSAGSSGHRPRAP